MVCKYVFPSSRLPFSFWWWFPSLRIHFLVWCNPIYLLLNLFLLLLESQPQNIAKTNVSGGGGGVVTKSCPTLVTPWTVACQAPLSMGFSRQEYRSGLPFPSPGHLPNAGIKPRSPALQADSLPTELGGKRCQSVYRFYFLPGILWFQVLNSSL